MNEAISISVWQHHFLISEQAVYFCNVHPRYYNVSCFFLIQVPVRNWIRLRQKPRLPPTWGTSWGQPLIEREAVAERRDKWPLIWPLTQKQNRYCYSFIIYKLPCMVYSFNVNPISNTTIPWPMIKRLFSLAYTCDSTGVVWRVQNVAVYWNRNHPFFQSPETAPHKRD